MTQVNADGPAPAADPAPAAMPAPDPQQAAPQQTPHAPAGDSDEFIRIPKASLAAYNGDWHAVAAEAKMLRQFQDETGIPFNEFAQQWLSFDPNAAAGDPPAPEVPGEPAPPADPQQAPLTEARMREILAEQAKNQQEAATKAQSQAEEARQKQAAYQARQQHAGDILKAAGFGPNEKTGQSPDEARYLGSVYQGMLDTAMLADVPAYRRDDNEYIGTYLDRAAPSPAQTAKAAETFKAFLANLGNTAVASFATGQSETPGQTLGTGAGGRKAPPDLTSMSPDERMKYVMTGKPA